MSVPLKVERCGSGPDLVLVHGWAMHSGVWHEFAEMLAQDFRVTLVDLPGHGDSPMLEGEYTLKRLAQVVLAVAPRQALWCGWSLGAQVALAARREAAERIVGIAALAGTPRFLAAPDWTPGVAAHIFELFAQDLIADYRSMLRRFLTLQLRGSPTLLRRLRASILAGPQPNQEALAGGLEILKGSDLRGFLRHTSVPQLWVLGEHDTLVPVALATALRVLSPGCRVETLSGAGHAPFLSHGLVCAQLLREFQEQLSTFQVSQLYE